MKLVGFQRSMQGRTSICHISLFLRRKNGFVDRFSALWDFVPLPGIGTKWQGWINPAMAVGTPKFSNLSECAERSENSLLPRLNLFLVSNDQRPEQLQLFPCILLPSLFDGASFLQKRPCSDSCQVLGCLSMVTNSFRYCIHWEMICTICSEAPCF